MHPSQRSNQECKRSNPPIQKLEARPGNWNSGFAPQLLFLVEHHQQEVEAGDDVVLVAVRRGEQLIVPRGELRLERDDQLTFFVASAGRDALESLLTAPLLEEPAG